MCGNISNNLHETHLNNTVLSLETLIQLRTDLLCVEVVVVRVFGVQLGEYFYHLDAVGWRVHQREYERSQRHIVLQEGLHIRDFLLQ